MKGFYKEIFGGASYSGVHPGQNWREISSAAREAGMLQQVGAMAGHTVAEHRRFIQGVEEVIRLHEAVGGRYE